jgi:methionyl-tRNA synthetase
VEPPEGAVPGERVTAAGFEGEPVAVLKKEAFDPIASGLKTNAELVACYQEQPLMTCKGPCTVRSVSHGAIR